MLSYIYSWTSLWISLKLLPYNHTVHISPNASQSRIELVGPSIMIFSRPHLCLWASRMAEVGFQSASLIILMPPVFSQLVSENGLAPRRCFSLVQPQQNLAAVHCQAFIQRNADVFWIYQGWQVNLRSCREDFFHEACNPKLFAECFLEELFRRAYPPAWSPLPPLKSTFEAWLESLASKKLAIHATYGKLQLVFFSGISRAARLTNKVFL